MQNTYDPILEIQDLSSLGLLYRPPAPEPGVAMVFSGNSKPLLTILQGQRGVSWGEMRWGFNKLYKVDIAEHPLEFAFDTPCLGQTYLFHVTVSLRCSVAKPELIVENRVNDAAAWIKGSFERAARVISARYDFHQAQEVEQELNSQASQALIGTGFAITGLLIKVVSNQEVIDWNREKIRIDAQSSLEHQRLKREQSLQQDLKKLELEAAIDQQTLEHRLAKQQAEFDIQMLKVKTDFYSSLLKAGNINILALQLSQNPGDVLIVQQALLQQQQAERDMHLRTLEVMIRADGVEGFQLSELGKSTIAQLMSLKNINNPALLPDNVEVEKILHEQKARNDSESSKTNAVIADSSADLRDHNSSQRDSHPDIGLGIF
jgi:hypothetical protein